MKANKNHLIAVNKYRTHTNGELSKKDQGKIVRLSGWVHARRDHGGLIFIDLRDKWGITQLTFNPRRGKDKFAAAEKLKSEDVIGVSGKVALRPVKMVNKNIATGEVELEVETVEVLGQSQTPPFEVAVEKEVNEEIRLRYRFLDLRRPRLQQMLKIRDRFITHIRKYMHGIGFTEVQTPILANSSPEGARDFLVPSRLYPGKFYALPQAPQQFKQLLMVGGLDRYFQIAPCFRDEDPRADRHAGDFYQIDLEMSFVEQEDVFAVVEPLMIELTKKFSQKNICRQPFPRLSWHTAMNKYGSDKPDLRYGLEIQDVTDLLNKSGFKVFDEALANGGVVHALPVAGGANFSRQDIDDLTKQAKLFGLKGLAYIKIATGASSPADKFIPAEVRRKIVDRLVAKQGDIVFFGAGSWLPVCKSLGAVRISCADKLKQKDDSLAAWVWITDFPMYEYNEEEKKINFSHNPFSMPQGGLTALNNKDPLEILGYQYDLALNGFEISSGAIRNHRPDIMYKAFAIAGYSQEEVDSKFGAMIKAFTYGAPPHGGFAPGVDRLLMILLNEPNIREIYAFPKDSKAKDLMTGSPAAVSKKQLKELQLKIDLDD